MSNVLWQSLLSPQSRLIVTSSSDDVSSDGILNSDAITVEVSVDDVRVGDSILVLPGETIPVDVRIRTIVLFFRIF
jgi:Cu2+-exporting ATPase